MTLDRPALLGIVFGIIIGGIYIALQQRALRQRATTAAPGGVVALVPGAASRLVFLIVAWWLVFEYTDANKYWLTGALVVTYTAPLLGQLKQFIFPKK